MKHFTDFAWIAFPFAAGSALSCFLPPGAPLGAVCTLSLAAIAFLLLHLHSGFAEKAELAALFALSGIFCYCSWALRSITQAPPGTQAAPIEGAAARSVGRLRSLIDAVPWDDGRCAPLLCALLTGDRSGLDRATIAAFRESGASHLLALSGLHLGFIYLIIRRISLFLPWRGPKAAAIRAAVVVLLCGFYTLMVGAGPSIVRAFLFICVNEIAGISPSRRRDPGRTLLAALTIQLAISPGVIGSVGFQLSYMAMAGIIWIFPHLEAIWPDSRQDSEPDRLPIGPLDAMSRSKSSAGKGWLLPWKPLQKVWSTSALSLSCQITTAPLAWHYFHTFPRYFLLTNIISLPLTSAVMALSIAVLALSAPGLCPGWLVSLDSRALTLLIRILDIIALM